jgi:hypothetical protein
MAVLRRPQSDRYNCNLGKTILRHFHNDMPLHGLLCVINVKGLQSSSFLLFLGAWESCVLVQ